MQLFVRNWAHSFLEEILIDYLWVLFVWYLCNGAETHFEGKQRELIVKLNLIMISTPGSYFLPLAEAIYEWSKKWMEDGSRKSTQLQLAAEIYSSFSDLVDNLCLTAACDFTDKYILSYHGLPQGSSLTTQVHVHSFQLCLSLTTLTSITTFSLGSQNIPCMNGSRNLWKNEEIVYLVQTKKSNFFTEKILSYNLRTYICRFLVVKIKGRNTGI